MNAGFCFALIVINSYLAPHSNVTINMENTYTLRTSLLNKRNFITWTMNTVLVIHVSFVGLFVCYCCRCFLKINIAMRSCTKSYVLDFSPFFALFLALPLQILNKEKGKLLVEYQLRSILRYLFTQVTVLRFL